MAKDQERPTNSNGVGTLAIARRCISLAIAITIGLIVCEGFLRILVPKPIFYSTWFTSGVHQTDNELGFVFQPNYDGAMRNADCVWMQPIRLDPNGFRQPATRTDRPGTDSVSRIVILGGASMAFCYGLSDADSLHHAVAVRMTGVCRIDLISWPGFTLGQDLRKLVRFTNPRSFEVAVLMAYGEDEFRDDSHWDRLPPRGELRMYESVVMPQDPAADLVGDLYYRSYVLAGVCRALRVPAKLLARFRSQLSGRGVSVAAVAIPNDVGEPAVHMAARRLRQLGIRSVVIVALPHQNQRVGPSSFPGPESADIHWLDLRNQPTHLDFDWIAYGHYGPKSVQHLSAKIAEAIERVR